MIVVCFLFVCAFHRNYNIQRKYLNGTLFQLDICVCVGLCAFFCPCFSIVLPLLNSHNDCFKSRWQYALFLFVVPSSMQKALLEMSFTHETCTFQLNFVRIVFFFFYFPNNNKKNYLFSLIRLIQYVYAVIAIHTINVYGIYFFFGLCVAFCPRLLLLVNCSGVIHSHGYFIQFSTSHQRFTLRDSTLTHRFQPTPQRRWNRTQ